MPGMGNVFAYIENERLHAEWLHLNGPLPLSLCALCAKFMTKITWFVAPMLNRMPSKFVSAKTLGKAG